MRKGILAGKAALVTGGGRGIGRSHALALAKAGAKVLVNDVGSSYRGEGSDVRPAEQVVDEIRALGGEAVANSTSVASWEGGEEIVRAAIESFGDIDILVNNAGIARMSEIDVLTREDWELTLAVNLTGTAAPIHFASAHWIASGKKKPRAIVNTSSPAGVNPLPLSPGYAATKAGVAALTMAISGPLASYGVRVNAIAPMARTRMLENAPDFIKEPMRARDGEFDAGHPDNISPLVVYLASPLCRFTGRTFGIGGSDLYLFDGYSARQHFSNGTARWNVEEMAEVLRDVDPQDRGWMIAPGNHLPGPNPTDEVLAHLEDLGA